MCMFVCVSLKDIAHNQAQNNNQILLILIIHFPFISIHIKAHSRTITQGKIETKSKKQEIDTHTVHLTKGIQHIFCLILITLTKTKRL